jgi:hypothetical protein
MAVSFTLTTNGDRDFRQPMEERSGTPAGRVGSGQGLAAMERIEFDRELPIVLRRAIVQTL